MDHWRKCSAANNGYSPRSKLDCPCLLQPSPPKDGSAPNWLAAAIRFRRVRRGLRDKDHSRTSRRDDSGFGLVSSWALFNHSCPRSGAPPHSLRHHGVAAHLPVWVAKDAGLFEKAGMNVEPVQIRGGSLITLAIITGDLPFSGVGAESVVAARAAGGDVILLACPVDADPVY